MLLAERGSDPVAGVQFLRHGSAATYYLAWTGPEGRAAHAHNLLLWAGVGRLHWRRWLKRFGRPVAQRAMAARAKAHVSEVAGSHAVYVSKPAAVAAIIEDAAKGAR